MFIFFILETILLGKALNVNPYDQPAVELIKTETKKNGWFQDDTELLYNDYLIVIMQWQSDLLVVLNAKDINDVQYIFDKNHIGSFGSAGGNPFSLVLGGFLNYTSKHAKVDIFLTSENLPHYCLDFLNHENIIFSDFMLPSANDMGILSNLNYTKKEFVDVSEFQPKYLKDFGGKKIIT